MAARRTDRRLFLEQHGSQGAILFVSGSKEYSKAVDGAILAALDAAMPKVLRMVIRRPRRKEGVR